METADELEYLTVEKMAWSKGYVRPRMSAEQRKIQHRVTQRKFMARKRARLDRLEEVLRKYKMILKWVKAQAEISRLQIENAALSLDVEVLDGDGLRSRGIVRQQDHDDVAASLPELLCS